MMSRLSPVVTDMRCADPPFYPKMLFTNRMGRVMASVMRFRPYIGWIGWLGIAAFSLKSTVHVLQYFLSGHQTQDLVLAALWLITPLLGATYYLFVYWDANPSGLIARRLWKVKRIPWQSVRSVGRHPLFVGHVMVSYGHPNEDCGRLLAAPANRTEFIAALCKYAPQAEFKI